MRRFTLKQLNNENPGKDYKCDVRACEYDLCGGQGQEFVQAKEYDSLSKSYDVRGSELVRARASRDSLATQAASDRTEISTLRLHLEAEKQSTATLRALVNKVETEKNNLRSSAQSEISSLHNKLDQHCGRSRYRYPGESMRAYDFYNGYGEPMRSNLSRDTIEVPRYAFEELLSKEGQERSVRLSAQQFKQNIAEAIGSKPGEDIVGVAKLLKSSNVSLQGRNDWQTKEVQRGWDVINTLRNERDAATKIVKSVHQISAPKVSV
jgi:hypothetical protein